MENMSGDISQAVYVYYGGFVTILEILAHTLSFGDNGDS
jgi:hypothetical protein